MTNDVTAGRARVHVTTRVTTRASELSTCLYTHIHRGSKIYMYKKSFYLDQLFFSSRTRCYHLIIKLLRFSFPLYIFFNTHFLSLFIYFFKLFFYVYFLFIYHFSYISRKLILVQTYKDMRSRERGERMEGKRRI